MVDDRYVLLGRVVGTDRQEPELRGAAAAIPRGAALGPVSRLPLVFLFALQALVADGVVVRFDPLDPQTGPYPADSLTVPDSTQITGKHVNLPLPDCTASAALCTELGLINQLDGFNVQPR